MSVLSWIIIYLLIGGFIYLVIYLLYPPKNVTYQQNLPSVSPSPVSAIVKVNSSSSKGNFLTDSNGMTLYIFDKDSNGVSNCTGKCVAIWPVFLASSQSNLPANITIIQRSDGLMQYAWKGMPLYYYASDKNPGDINGDGFGGIWHLVKP